MKRWQMKNLSILAVLLLVWTVSAAADGFGVAAEPAKRVLIVVGPSNHPPGTHEVAAGARVIKHCLENAKGIGPVAVDLVDGWPKDKQVVQAAAAIVLIGDLFPPEVLPEPEKVKAELSAAMDRGCGLVCVHYATGLRAQHVSEDGDHPLLRWLGGYFATGCPHHKSVARVVPATITPGTGDHPVLRGWKEFRFDDEPYWNNYFGKEGPAKNVTVLATAMLPPEQPKQETVAWAVERADGGRGVGIVVPHFFRNWQIGDLRTLVLNAVCWSAKCEIPATGVQASLPDLAAFEPVSVEPKPRPQK